MSADQPDVIDIVAVEAAGDVLLVIVEGRPWGERGLLLPDLQRKLNTYLAYVTEGQLTQDYPAVAGRPVHIQLRAVEAPGPRELEFLALVIEHHLEPEGIRFSWRVLSDAGVN